MAATLPHAERLKLEQALGQWRQWQCHPPLPGAPHIERSLTDGQSNWSVLVGAAGRRFVVRIDGVAPSANGINRQCEWRVLQAAHREGLAPGPRYFNPELGVMVCDYLPPDDLQPADPAELAHLLRRIHQLPARRHRLQLPERLARYEKLLERQYPKGHPLLQAHRHPVWEQLNLCEAGEQTTVLCHNDLLHANRLYSDGRLYALDWEYAAMASPWYELAVVTAGDDMPRMQQDILLQHYLHRTPSAEECLLLQRYACVYRYLELAWYLAQRRQVLSDGQLAARGDLLAGLLAEVSRGSC